MNTAKLFSLFLTLFSLILFSPAAVFADGNYVPGWQRYDPHAPRIRNKNGTSLNWSGYAVETNLSNPQNGAVSDVKGTWTVPTLTCSSTNTYSAQWIGIDGYSDNTVEQTGTESDCINGQLSYYAWYEMYPKNSAAIQYTVHAGDTMNAEVNYVGGGIFQLTLNNQTANTSFTTKQKLGSAKRQSAEWIVEAPWSGGILPLANFGSQSFSNATATINGVTGSIYNSANPAVTPWQNDPITMENQSGGTKAYPYGLSSDGSSFNVQWVSSN